MNDTKLYTFWLDPKSMTYTCWISENHSLGICLSSHNWDISIWRIDQCWTNILLLIFLDVEAVGSVSTGKNDIRQEKTLLWHNMPMNMILKWLWLTNTVKRLKRKRGMKRKQIDCIFWASHTNGYWFRWSISSQHRHYIMTVGCVFSLATWSQSTVPIRGLRQTIAEEHIAFHFILLHEKCCVFSSAPQQLSQ